MLVARNGVRLNRMMAKRANHMIRFMGDNALEVNSLE